MIEVKITEDIDLRGKRFVTGFQGIGLVGYVSVRHIIKSLKPKKIGYIMSDSVPPVVSAEGGSVRLPFELYSKGELVLLSLESLPVSREMQKFCKGVTDWVIKVGLRDALLIGGLDASFATDGNGQDYRILCTSAARPLITGLRTLEDGLFVVGPLALFMSMFEYNDFPAIAVLPYASRDRADPRAAAKAIEFINDIYGVDVNTEELIADAESIEEELRRHAAAETHGNDESLGYIK
ncbi:MAG: PAC2 family protein [Thermoprotei archaeon]